MKVYLATAFPKAAELAIPYAVKLEAVGIEITCKWWDQPPCPFCDLPGPPGRCGKKHEGECGCKCHQKETELSIEEQRAFADKDLAGVEQAEVVWVLSPGPSGGTGCWFEAGYAHALGKIVVVSGHPRTIFAARQNVFRFVMHDAALTWIKDWM